MFFIIYDLWRPFYRLVNIRQFIDCFGIAVDLSYTWPTGPRWAITTELKMTEWKTTVHISSSSQSSINAMKNVLADGRLTSSSPLPPTTHPLDAPTDHPYPYTSWGGLWVTLLPGSGIHCPNLIKSSRKVAEFVFGQQKITLQRRIYL